MKRFEVVLKFREAGVIPLFYHPDLELCKGVMTACYRGGIRVFEFTNRGEFAHELFAELVRWGRTKLPGMILGAGTVVDPGTASLYIQLGASFVISPVLNEDMARICNRRKVLWIPGCATASEINRAEELGAEIVKLFPGPAAGGPGFLRAYLAPCPWSNIMPTGGVSPTEENLREWFEAGAFCVGIGSGLITGEILQKRDFGKLEQMCRDTVGIIRNLNA